MFKINARVVDNGIMFDDFSETIKQLMPIIRLKYKLRLKSKRLRKKYAKRIISEALDLYLKSSLDDIKKEIK
jgi:hypothetical protein